MRSVLPCKEGNRQNDCYSEILREIVPGASKIALLVNPGNPMHRLNFAEPRRLGVALPIVEASTTEELDTAFASAAAQHADGIVMLAMF